MAYVPPSTWFSSAAKWLQEPGNQNLLAGIGAKLDPQGIGGALGTATVGYNQSRVAAARADTQEKLAEQQRQSALKLLLTPPGTPGPTKVEAKKDGSIIQTSDVGTSSVVTPPPAPTPAAVPPVTTAPAAAAGTSEAPTQMPPMTVTAQREPAATPNPYSTTATVEPFDVRQIAPFLLSPGNRGSLSGLTPEQINSIRGTENETERLRLSSFANIIQAEDVRSQISYREATGQLTRAQADTLRLQQPHVVSKMLAEIDQNKEAAAFSRQQRIRSETLTPIEARKEEAGVERERAGTALANAQSRRISELIEYEKNKITADINQSNAAAGYSRAHQKQIEDISPLQVKALQKDIDQYVDMEMSTEPGKKQQFTLKGPELIKAIEDKRKQVAVNYEKHETRKREARKDAQLALKASTDAEQNLISQRPGGFAMIDDAKELLPDADMFHATSLKPYIYVLETDPGLTDTGVKINRRDLPTVDGHKYTAQEIYDKATPLGMTVQEYMEKVFYPKLVGPVPWNTGVKSTLKPAAK